MEDKSYLMKFAALFGLYTGIFWIFKYLLVIFGEESNYLSTLYTVFTAAVPFIAYRFTTLYREQACAGVISFFHAWQFGILLYTFAAIVVSLVHYYHYKILGSEQLAKIVEQALSLLSSSKIDPKLLEYAQSLAIPTPFQMTMQSILNNIMTGALFSIPVALLAKRKNKTI